MRLVLVALVGLASALATGNRGPFAPKCRVGEAGLYNPQKATQVPWFNVNLDDEPRERFKGVVAPFSQEIKDVIAIIKKMLSLFGPLPIEVLDYVMNIAHDQRMDSPYKEEIEGIAEVTGVSVAELSMMNIFYEISRFCTSIVAENPNGQLFHGRNLDFGQLFFWNQTTRSWALTDSLKKITVNINFIKNGKVLFKATTFAGHVGALTGMKPKAFTLSMNAKLKPDIGNIVSWLMGTVKGVHFAMWVEREVMEKANNFEEARQLLSTVPQLAGAYYILGGTKPGEGMIIVRNETGVVTTRRLDPSNPDKWFVLQTNYDPDQKVLYLDDRRDPGNKCMKQLTPKKLSAEGLYQVLSSKTNLNKTTVHTVIMSVTTGLYQSFIQYCPDPCWFL